MMNINRAGACVAVVVAMGMSLAAVAAMPLSGGDVRILPYSRLPGGVARADGSAISITDHPDTFARVGLRGAKEDGGVFNTPKLAPLLSSKAADTQDLITWAKQTKAIAIELKTSVESIKTHADTFAAACAAIEETRSTLDKWRADDVDKKTPFERFSERADLNVAGLTMAIAELEKIETATAPTDAAAHKKSVDILTAHASYLSAVLIDAKMQTERLARAAENLHTQGGTKLDTPNQALAEGVSKAQNSFVQAGDAVAKRRPEYTVAVEQFVALDGRDNSAYLAEVRLFAIGYAPREWMKCNGARLSIPQNTALYSLLLKQFGSDDKTWFALPNLAAPEALDASGKPLAKQEKLVYCIASRGTYPAEDFGAAGNEPEGTLGEIRLMATRDAPDHWAECNGGPRKAYDQSEILFWLIGTTFGGDGVQTYQLPKLAPVKAADGTELKFYICVRGIWPSRD